jgi:hypothetical protein
VRRDRIAVDGGGLGGQHQRAYGVQPLVRAIPPVRSRRGPRRCKPGKVHLRLTKLRVWGRDQGIAVRITGKDVESGRGLGRYPWVVERTIAWLFGYRRLAVRWPPRKAPS